MCRPPPKKKPRVLGHHAPPPRLTGFGAGLLAAPVGLAGLVVLVVVWLSG